MRVEIVNTGSELMLGRVLNTHQQWLCRRLADLGHVVTRQVAIADTGSEIQTAVREALNRADLIITTGGLGPTSDDLTRELVAELLGKKLVANPDVLAHIENFFTQPVKHQRGRGCHQQHAKMNARRGFAEQRHDRGIGIIRSGKFHVVGQRVRRNALQNQLASVGIFTLIAFQWKIEQPQPRPGDDEQHRQREPAEPDFF